MNSEYSSWMTAGLNKCTCGGFVVLYYDGNHYHTECQKCNKRAFTYAESVEEAKKWWNESKLSEGR